MWWRIWLCPKRGLAFILGFWEGISVIGNHTLWAHLCLDWVLVTLSFRAEQATADNLTVGWLLENYWNWVWFGEPLNLWWWFVKEDALRPFSLADSRWTLLVKAVVLKLKHNRWGEAGKKWCLAVFYIFEIVRKTKYRNAIFSKTTPFDIPY